MTKNNKLKKILITVGVIVVVLAAVVGGLYLSVSRTAEIPSSDEAAVLVSNAIDSMYGKNSAVAKEISEDIELKINDIEQDGTGCLINVTIDSADIGTLLETHLDEIVALDNGTVKSDELKASINEKVVSLLPTTEKTTATVDIICADVDGTWKVYKSEELADAVYPGLYKFNQDNSESEVKAVKRLLTLTDIKIDKSEPDTRNWIQRSVDELKAQFKLNFITDGRWKMIVNGLLTTLEITGVSLVIGVVLGIIVAAIRASFDKNNDEMKKRGGIGYGIMSFLNGICKIYLTVIRGTPVVVQVLIYYFIIFKSLSNGTLVAMLAFGINSGAYVAEIFRGGIMSIDNGQFEAGRSLGFNYVQTMCHVVIPQVFKAVLPTLCNEFIALLKETSIVGYVGEVDLTKAGDLIRGRTFSAFMPLILVALVYLALVMLLTFLVSRLERRLRKSERRHE